jgi:hypothetical protein
MTAWERRDIDTRLLQAVGALRCAALPPDERRVADRIAADIVDLLARLERNNKEVRGACSSR